MAELCGVIVVLAFIIVFSIVALAFIVQFIQQELNNNKQREVISDIILEIRKPFFLNIFLPIIFVMVFGFKYMWIKKLINIHSNWH